jgi:hypothetical protein
VQVGIFRSAAIFGGLLALIVAAYYSTKLSHTLLFWAAFVLTRPLGAVLGDFLDKPLAQGGLASQRCLATAVLLGFIVLCVVLVRSEQRRVIAGAESCAVRVRLWSASVGGDPIFHRRPGAYRRAAFRNLRFCRGSPITAVGPARNWNRF